MTTRQAGYGIQPNSALKATHRATGLSERLSQRRGLASGGSVDDDDGVSMVGDKFVAEPACGSRWPADVRPKRRQVQQSPGCHCCTVVLRDAFG